MYRFFLIGFAWFAVTSSLAAVPARPLYEPEDPPKPPPPPKINIMDLRGTAWLGKYNAANRTYIFEPNGTLSYKTTTKTIFKNYGSWRIEGNRVSYEYGSGKTKLMEFRGTIQDNNTIIGEATYLNGNKAVMTLQRTLLQPQ
jgi:hypothetical protein